MTGRSFAEIKNKNMSSWTCFRISVMGSVVKQSRALQYPGSPQILSTKSSRWPEIDYTKTMRSSSFGITRFCSLGKCFCIPHFTHTIAKCVGKRRLMSVKKFLVSFFSRKSATGILIGFQNLWFCPDNIYPKGEAKNEVFAPATS